jgi:hypothetical protein
MKAFTIILWIYLAILLLLPVLTYAHFKKADRDFEKARREYILKYGDDQGLYGDCTGMSWILPIAFNIYTWAFLIWSVILLCLRKSISKNGMLVQVLLIGLLGVLPAAGVDLLFAVHVFSS